MTVADFIMPLGGVGGLASFVVFMFRRVDRYQDKIEKRLSQVEADNARCNRRFNLLLGAFHPVVAALRRHDAMSPELAGAELALRQAFPIDPQTPAEMKEMLERIR